VSDDASFASQAQSRQYARPALRATLEYWRNLRSWFIVVAVITLVVATTASVAYWLQASATNEEIGKLAAGRDHPVDMTAASELLAARIGFLTKRDEMDEARALADSLERRGKSELSAGARYNLGNALLRNAFVALEKGDTERSIPLIALAKQEYRRALQFKPDFWDAKFNLDVASRLVRDFNEFERKGGDEAPLDPKKIWTDIPGVPKGLP
jgi:mxaK protein